MSTTTVGTEKVDIGRVIQETIATVRRNLGVLAGLAFALTIAPGLLTSILGTVLGLSAFLPGRMSDFGVFIPLFGGFSLIFLFCWGAFQAATVHVTVSDRNGRRSTFSAGLAVGVRNALPLIGVVFLASLATMFGMIFLVAPGVMIAIAFILAVPAQVAERTGVFGAFARSRALTRNNRWRIFGLVMIYAVTIWVFEAVVMGVTAGLRSSPIVQVALASIIMMPLGFVSAIFTTTGIATLYVEMRRIKEGVGVSELAAVFD